MKITNGKDYYDHALSYGQDDNIVFLREKHRFVETIPVPLRRIVLKARKPYQYFDLIHSYRMINNREHRLARVTVVFCGKVYHGIVTTVNDETVYLWDKDKIKDYLRLFGFDISKNDLAEFGCEPASNQLLDWLITNQVVVTICFPGNGPPMWAINSDQLKDVQFYRVLDSYAAFQEIAMWIGGVLPAQGAIPIEIDDKTRIAKHGFDKNSFRRRTK